MRKKTPNELKHGEHADMKRLDDASVDSIKVKRSSHNIGYWTVSSLASGKHGWIRRDRRRSQIYVVYYQSRVYRLRSTLWDAFIVLDQRLNEGATGLQRPLADKYLIRDRILARATATTFDDMPEIRVDYDVDGDGCWDVMLAVSEFRRRVRIHYAKGAELPFRISERAGDYLEYCELRHAVEAALDRLTHYHPPAAMPD